MDFNRKPTTDESRSKSSGNASEHIRRALLFDHYEEEINTALNQLEFNLVVIGSPRVGKSELINAICGERITETSSSLDSCTQEIKQYIVNRFDLQLNGFPQVEITIFDTPGIENWKEEESQEKFLEFIKTSNPMCVIYCASPGSFTSLESLRYLLQYCKHQSLICALVCTDMWSGNKRQRVIEEFKKELHIFGDERSEEFPQTHDNKPHLVTFFGNGALCTMVNSIEYRDEDMNFSKPSQGVDELIYCIMSLLDEKKLLGWCITVLDRRDFWKKMSQKTNGFFQLRIAELQSIRDKSAGDLGREFLFFLAETYIKAR